MAERAARREAFGNAGNKEKTQMRTVKDDLPTINEFMDHSRLY